MQVSGGHLLAAGLDGGNTVIFALGENVTSPFGGSDASAAGGR